LDEARIDLMEQQANSLKLEYMLKDEVRKQMGLKDPLANSEWQTLKTEQVQVRLMPWCLRN
jgi:hypothetical protein